MSNREGEDFIAELVLIGFSLRQVLDAVCDGELVGSWGLTQDEAEEIYNLIKRGLK